MIDNSDQKYGIWMKTEEIGTNVSDRNIRFIIALVAAILCITLSGALYLMGFANSSKTQPVSTATATAKAVVSQMSPAGQIAQKFHCKDYLDGGTALYHLVGVTDFGGCDIADSTGHTDYTAYVFVSQKAKNAYISGGYVGQGTGDVIVWQSSTDLFVKHQNNYN